MKITGQYNRKWFGIRVSSALVLGWLSNCGATPVSAQVIEGKPHAIHLVGHEDVALLARVQEVIDDWDPRKLVNPYVETVTSRDSSGKMTKRKVLRRPDLAEFIADVDAAEALGKAFFWEMQAGSDFRRRVDGVFVGTACASCHYQHGMDARRRHSERIPYVVWEKYPIDKTHGLEFGISQLPFDPKKSAVFDTPLTDRNPLTTIVGSQGVERKMFTGRNVEAPSGTGEWESEKWSVKPKSTRYEKVLEEWLMFFEDHDPTKQAFRQITSRNSPTVINSGFSDRLFHDGRAESTFNGFSIFGDFDERQVLYRVAPVGPPVPVKVAILKAALASQSVGPIVNEVEMSYQGRTFHDVANKLLDSKILQHQRISATDSVLGKYAISRPTYRALIERAFRREWWDSQEQVSLELTEAKEDKGSLEVANFSLFWGLSILIYESELVSNNSPFDAMMMGNPQPVNDRWEKEKSNLQPIYLDRARTKNPPPAGVVAPPHNNGASVFQHGFRVFMNRGCIECHSGPLLSEIYERIPAVENRIPIAKDLHRTLVPMPLADSIPFHDRPFHEQILKQIELAISSATGLQITRVAPIARGLEQLRFDALGNTAELKKRIESRLSDLIAKPDDRAALADKVSKLLKRYEVERVNRLGGRKFFSEDDRIGVTEPLVEPLFVELMPIPKRQIETRPVLPFVGPYAERRQPKPNYAFYDLGFYNLGVSPPRFDRGIGAIVELDEHDLHDKNLNTAIATLPAAEAAIAMKADRSLLLQQMKSAKVEYVGELDEKSVAAIKDALKELFSIEESVQQSASGAAGSAYRLKRSKPKASPPQAQALAPPTTAAPAPIVFSDQSWDRIGLRDEEGNDTRNRSAVHFLSRARALVLNEEPWGLRKPFLHDNELAFWGAFRTPSLRNVELTAPYMHNGRLSSLREVVEFYDRAGDVPRHAEYNPDKHPEIVDLDMTIDDKLALQFFLMCLTDEAVRNHKAPFDHPSINLVNGYSSVLPTAERIERIMESK